MKRERSFVRTYLILLISLLVLCTGITVFIDPYFHYHAPLQGISYQADDPRYINPGIAEHFTYDGIIAGTSMIADFSIEEAEALFGSSFVKLIFKGGSYNEIGGCIERALRTHPNCKVVLRALDFSHLVEEKDAPFHGIADDGYLYPNYLYDDSLVTDFSYFLNKSTVINLARNLFYTIKRAPSFDMSTYAGNTYSYSYKNFLPNLTPIRQNVSQRVLSDDEKENLTENLEQNVLAAVRKHPDVEFDLFFPPMNAVHWKLLYESGELETTLEAMQITFEKLLSYPNVRMFSFFEDYDTICNLNLHHHSGHYSPEVSSLVLQYISNDEYRITEENYLNHLSAIRDYYTTLDYTTLKR